MPAQLLVDEDLGRWDTCDPPLARTRVHAGSATLRGRPVGPSGRKGIPLSYCYMSLLGFPFKYRLGLTKKRADWLVNWLREVLRIGSVMARDMSQKLGRLGFAAIALDWERPFLGPLCLVLCE